MLSKALELASVSIGGPLMGYVERRFFLRAFEVMRYIKRYVKVSCKWASLSIGAPLGNWREFTYRDVLREKESISGFLSWTQRTLCFYVWGPSGILLERQGSPELVSDYGAQRAHL
jgi:hypothetical protein